MWPFVVTLCIKTPPHAAQYNYQLQHVHKGWPCNTAWSLHLCHPHSLALPFCAVSGQEALLSGTKMVFLSVSADLEAPLHIDFYVLWFLV